MNEMNAKKHYCGMTKQEIYAEKLGTLQDALDLIQGGDSIVWPIHCNEPRIFLDGLATINDRLDRPVELWAAVQRFQHDVLNSTGPHVDKFHVNTFFYDSNTRAAHPSGRVSMFPCDLHAYGRELHACKEPNVFAAQVSAMDQFGY